MRAWDGERRLGDVCGDDDGSRRRRSRSEHPCLIPVRQQRVHWQNVDWRDALRGAVAGPGGRGCWSALRLLTGAQMLPGTHVISTSRGVRSVVHMLEVYWRDNESIQP